MAAVARADIVLHRFNLYKVSALFKLFNNGFSALITIHTLILAGIFVHLAVLGQNIDNGKIVAQTDLKVVGVVSGCDFNNACSEIYFNIIIGNNRNFFINNRKNNLFADYVFVSFIIRVNSNSGIAEHCFGSCCGKLNIAAAVCKRISYMPKRAVKLFILNLCVRNRGAAMCAPVDNSFAAVYELFLIKVNKHLANGF